MVENVCCVHMPILNPFTIKVLGHSQSVTVPLSLYIMRDVDLTVPIILGIDFLLESRMILDFSKAQYSLRTEEGTDEANFYHPLHHNVYPSLHFYLAIPFSGGNYKSRQQIQQLAQAADTETHVKKQLEELLLSWPSVCTQEIGRTSIVKHHIITRDEVPVRWRAYRVSREKQQFIESEIQELLKRRVIQPSTSPWAAPVVVVPKKDGGSRFCIDYRSLKLT